MLTMKKTGKNFITIRQKNYKTKKYDYLKKIVTRKSYQLYREE